jgi:hypothetical protein
MIKNNYQPKYPIGYSYRVGNSLYTIEKIEDGVYYERCSNFVGYSCVRCDVFDANHGSTTTISKGIGLPPHPEA